MKRWITFLGRCGTVLITIGLALILVSLIPSAQLGTSQGSAAVPPKWVESSVEMILTPQQGLRISIAANGTLDVYILEVSSQVLHQWGNNDFLNVTDLEEFLEANSGVIGWYGEVRNGRIGHEYVPTKVTNATLVFSNPSSEYVPVDYEASMMSSLAPGAKVRNLAQWAIPVGFAFSLPWLTQMWRRKARARSSFYI